MTMFGEQGFVSLDQLSGTVYRLTGHTDTATFKRRLKTAAVRLCFVADSWMDVLCIAAPY